VNIRNSDDAGKYFCELEFYSSLATLYERDDFAKVAYLHVPPFRHEMVELDTEASTALAFSLIGVLVDQLPRSTELYTKL
jgi:pyrrolidone-carboxylate peptidase